MLLEWLILLPTLAYAMWDFRPLTVLAAFIVIGTRQHGLFILFHDAVHVLLARSRRVNDFLTNLLVGVPLLVPVQTYRALHLTHHQKLGTAGDPERVLLYRGQDWNYRPLPLLKLVRQLLLDFLLVNNVAMLVRFELEKRRADSPMQLPPVRHPPEYVAMIVLFVVANLVALWLEPRLFARFALLWYGPLLTLVQLLQKIRSFAEHADLDAPELTYSWEPGILGRLTIWPWGIHWHREHHERPNTAWHALRAAFPNVERRPGKALWRLLWNGRLRN